MAAPNILLVILFIVIGLPSMLAILMAAPGKVFLVGITLATILAVSVTLSLSLFLFPASETRFGTQYQGHFDKSLLVATCQLLRLGKS